MRISVIIPVYNVERYLARCLDSVLASVRNLSAGDSAEIICVNDGSTDQSAEVLSRYADRVRIFEKKNGGPSSARNLGLDMMTGDYVVFVDSDDMVTKDALSQFAQIARLSGEKLIVSMSFMEGSISDGEAPIMERPFRIRKASWISGKKVQYSVWNKLFAVEIVRSRRFLPVVYEDFPFITEVLCDVGTFASIEHPFYVYSKNTGARSIVHSEVDKKKLDSSIAVVRHVLDYAKGRSCFGFALRQAADGHSSTIGQIYKTRDRGLWRMLLTNHHKLVAEYPELQKNLSLKAKFRLWRMVRSEP